MHTQIKTKNAEFFTPLKNGRALQWRASFSELGLRELSLLRETTPPARNSLKLPARIAALREKIVARGAGKNVNLRWDEFDLRGHADFHLKVWRAMHAIPFGTVATYAETADLAGSPLAFRACGQACKNNPIILFIPCHRVVASTGIGGFNNRLNFKRMLLAWEGVEVNSAKFKVQNV